MKYLSQEPITSFRNDLTRNGELEDPQPPPPPPPLAFNLLSLLNLNYSVSSFGDDPAVCVDAVEWNDELFFHSSVLRPVARSDQLHIELLSCGFNATTSS